MRKPKVDETPRSLPRGVSYPKRRTTTPSPLHTLYPYLLRGVVIERPNQVWCTDITYIKLRQGFVYLAELIDVYSRKIVAWRLSISLEADLCHEMLEEALEIGIPEIINTDQRSQFTSSLWIEKVVAAGSQVSMDGKGVVWIISRSSGFGGQ